MSSPEARQGDRFGVLDLLADRATEGLDPRDERRLQELLRRDPAIDPDCLDRAAAAAVLAWMGPPSEPLPVEVRQRLRRAAGRPAAAPGDHR